MGRGRRLVGSWAGSPRAGHNGTLASDYGWPDCGFCRASVILSEPSPPLLLHAETWSASISDAYRFCSCSRCPQPRRAVSDGLAYFLGLLASAGLAQATCFTRSSSTRTASTSCRPGRPEILKDALAVSSHTDRRPVCVRQPTISSGRRRCGIPHYSYCSRPLHFRANVGERSLKPVDHAVSRSSTR